MDVMARHPGRVLIQTLWLVLLLFLTACGSSGGGGGGGETPGGEPADPRPGIGKSTGTPVGVAYVLPDGIELVEPIEGYDYDCIPPEQEQQEAKGSGSSVRLCLQLRNVTPQAITVDLPPGLIFVSTKLTTQNGILLQRTSVTVPAQQPLFVPLFLYCLNESRSTSSPGDTFELGPVTLDGPLLEVIALLVDKPLPVTGSPHVQLALSHVTDGDGLKQSDRDYINSL